MKRAVVTGAEGRVGAAFHARLEQDGFAMLPEAEFAIAAICCRPYAYIFHCAYDPTNVPHHLETTLRLMERWPTCAGIFVPSSHWIGTDTHYGLSKLIVEQTAKFYRLQAANIFTIGSAISPVTASHQIPPTRSSTSSSMAMRSMPG
jgi:hypothetical protein